MFIIDAGSGCIPQVTVPNVCEHDTDSDDGSSSLSSSSSDADVYNFYYFINEFPTKYEGLVTGMRTHTFIIHLHFARSIIVFF